jgi:rod shape-determining protein MreC
MLKFIQKNLSWFFLALLLAVCVWILERRASHPGSRMVTLKGLSLSVWLPFQKAVDWVVTFPENTVNAVRELKVERQEVERLNKENEALHMELSNQRSMQSELDRLQTVLRLKSHLPHTARIARIIAHDPSTWNSSFIIDAGTDDGVMTDSAVISEQGGIIGRVLETTPRHSRVLLVTDSFSSVAGMDERSKVTGVVQGSGRNLLKLSYVNAGEDVQKGDAILSNGLGGIFPKGYTIGSVVKKTQSDNGLYTDIEVIPAVDLAALDYVFILPPINAYE